MKCKITKIIAIFIFGIMIGLFYNNIFATDEQVKNTVDNFLTYIEQENSSALKYIDQNNNKLYTTVQENLYSISSIDYQITKITQKNDIYHVKVKVSAKGDNWKLNGITVKFDIKEVDNSYKIIDTDLFQKASSEYIIWMVFSIFAFIGIIFFIVIITIVIIVIIVIVKSNKKKIK